MNVPCDQTGCCSRVGMGNVDKRIDETDFANMTGDIPAIETLQPVFCPDWVLQAAGTENIPAYLHRKHQAAITHSLLEAPRHARLPAKSNRRR